tara:strand:+ start:1817 stop:2200 length:384 start_codon:yes stop_codon:yes gene_type:complete
MKKLKPGHYIGFAFILLIGLLIGSNFLNKNNEKELIADGIETTAIITKIDVNNYKANEMEGTYVENYMLTFNFSVDGKNIKSIRTVGKKEYDKYFKRALYVNDTISILYDSSNPKNNQIKELNLAKN